MKPNVKAYLLPIVYLTIIIVAVVYVNWRDYTVGFRLNLYPKIQQPAGLTAGEPFHVSHGWTLEKMGKFGYSKGYEFRLEVDRNYIEPDVIVKTIGNQPPGHAGIRYIFNFRNGLPAGIHTFTPHWISPCYAELGDVPSQLCDNPFEPVEWGVREYQIFFKEP